MIKVEVGVNDFETWCKQNNTELLTEWNYNKNENINPANIHYGTSLNVWWVCKFGHEWKARICNRTKRNTRCPYCVGQKAIKGVNDLLTVYPQIAKEWNYDKNGDLKPSDVMPNSNKKVWWLGECGHEWQAVIAPRVSRNCGCPICNNRKVLIGFNDLATTHPKLCDEWDYIKNKNIKPTDVTYGSTKKVWWKCKYGHEWQATINDRSSGKGCSKCSGVGTSLPEQGIAFYLEKVCEVDQRVKINNYEIDVYLPEYNIGVEYDGKYYHTADNIYKETKKDDELLNAGVKIIRIKESDFNEVRENVILYDFDNLQENYEWAINELIKLLVSLTSNEQFYKINVDIKRDLLKIRERLNLYENEKSLFFKNPLIAKEWNYEKNGDLKPEMFTYGSHMKVWWKCKYGHEWQEDIKTRAIRDIGCPFCAGQRAIKGVNDLATMNPEIAKEWHPTKNGDLKPFDVMSKSNKKVWWLGECGHEWETMVIHRTGAYKTGCPYCSNQRVLIGYNDLATMNPEIAKEWHPTKNGDLKSSDLVSGSNKKVWWQCVNGHEWEASVLARTTNNVCPYCSNKEALQGFNDLATTNPEVAKEWHPKKNGDLKPFEVTAHSSRKVWWRCAKGHEWDDRINHRVSKNSSCPFCSGVKKRVINMDTKEIFDSISSVTRRYGISSASIVCCCKGKTQTAGGYHWEYYDN